MTANATLEDLLQPHQDQLSTITVDGKSYTLVLGSLSSKRAFVDRKIDALKTAAPKDDFNDVYAARAAHWMLSDERSVPHVTDDTVEMTIKLMGIRGPLYDRITSEAVRLLNGASATGN